MASQPDLTNIAISSGYTTILHTEESGGISGSYTNVYDGDGTLAPIALATTGVKIIDGSYDFDVASHDGTNGLRLGGTLVTASATELNYLDVSSIGTAQASKALILDSSSDISGIRNLTATGTIQASAFTATGDTIIGDSVANDTVAFNSTITTNLVFEGSTANAYETTLSITDPTADRTWTIPDATDTSVGRATTDTLTNKTLTAPDINTPDIDGGTVDAITSLTVANNVDIGSYDLRAGTLTADGLTSGRVVFAGTNGVLSDDSDLSFSGATLSATNMTSSGTVTFGSLSDGSITITAFVDEDDMSSNSATLIPTQQSVVSYIQSQITAQDLDFQGDSGGALNIDLDSETLDIAGGTGIDTSGSSNTLTVAIDSTVATLAGSQTLSNKTLASPTITTQFTIGSATISEAELEILDGASVTTTELNIMDGDTNATSTTVADADRVVMNDAGTMKQVTVTDLSAYFDDEITAMPNLASVGTLTALQVDNVNVNGNAITSTDSNGNIDLTPNGTGEVNISKVDIDSGTIDGATIATSDVTVGSGKTLDVSSGTLTLANNQISGDKVEGGTIAGTTITALTTAGITASANIDIGSYDLRASTLTADSQTSGNVAIYGTNGLLSEDSDLTFSGSTLTATNVTISGTLTTTGSVQEVSTTNLNVQDPLILLNKYDSQPSNNAYDAGLVIKRGSSDSAPANVAMIWDESANTFGFIDTDDDGTTAGNVTVTDYENLRVGALTADDASTFTSTISTASGSTIGNLTFANGSISDSSGAISFGNENLSTSGTLGAGAITGTSFIIGSADIGEAELEILDGATVTTDELNLIDGGTARGTTAVASGDGILINDGGTMRMTNVDTVSTYFSSHNVGGGNIVSTGAINSGSITSGFGTIDTGSSNITTTGVGAFGSLDISGDVDVDGTLEADAITIDTKALDEFIADTIGAMVGSNTETGIAVTYEDGDNTLDFVLGATQTTLTSILNASLVAGRDADNQIKFSTDDQIIFRVAGGDGVTMKASGEIEATSLDISGDLDVDGTANLDVVDIAGAVTIASTGTNGSPSLAIDNSSNASYIHSAEILSANLGAGNNNIVVIGKSGDAKKSGWIGYKLVADSESNDNLLVFGHYGTTELMSINGAGNVGIGTASPDFLLDCEKAGSQNIRVHSTDDNAGVIIASDTDEGQISFLAFASGADYRGEIKYDHDTTAASQKMQFKVGDNAVTAMTILGDGNVGIGTASPSSLLHVEATSGHENATGMAYIHKNYATNHPTLVVEQSGAGGNNGTNQGILLDVVGTALGKSFEIQNAGTERVTVLNNGNVGIGTTSPQNDFVVSNGGANGMEFGAGASSSTIDVFNRSTSSYTPLSITPSAFTVDLQGGQGTIQGNNAGEYIARFHNDGNNVNRYGIVVSAGEDSESGSNYYFTAQDGDGNNTGYLKSVGGTFQLSDTSDIRLKKNVKDTTIKGIETVDKIKIRDFDWKKNDNTVIGGFIANELKEVYPQAVDGEADGVWEDGSIKAMTVSRDVLVPLLIKAVQELSAKVEALENA